MLTAEQSAGLSWIGRKSVEAFEDKLRVLGPISGPILHLNPGKLFGGIEQMLLAFALYSKDSCPIHMFGISFNGIILAKLREMSAIVHFLGEVRMLNPVGLFFSRRRLSLLLDEISPEVIIFHNPWMQYLFGRVASQKKIKIVRMLHTIPSPKFDWFEKCSAKVKPDLVIANSLLTGEAFKKANPGLPLMISYPPCILGDRSKRNYLREKTRRKIGISDSKYVIFSAGRFEDWKGFDILLAALAKLPQELNWECWIAGQACCNAEKKVHRNLKLMSDNLGISKKIKWLGFVDSMDAYYAAADVYCQPNKSPESFGMTFIESQAMGCPVITTGFGGALEILGNDTNNVLVPKATPEIIKNALIKVLNLV